MRSLRTSRRTPLKGIINRAHDVLIFGQSARAKAALACAVTAKIEHENGISGSMKCKRNWQQLQIGSQQGRPELVPFAEAMPVAKVRVQDFALTS